MLKVYPSPKSLSISRQGSGVIGRQTSGGGYEGLILFDSILSTNTKHYSKEYPLDTVYLAYLLTFCLLFT